MEMNDIIFTANGKVVTYEDFHLACRSVGIRPGDTIFVHSSLVSLGENWGPEIQKPLALIVKALQDLVGASGTMLMPTFTYSFLNETWSGPAEKYDSENSPTKTGTLSEYFRKQSDVHRTAHPTHSVAVWGAARDYYLDIGRSTFGSDSIFGKLHFKNAKIIGLGVDLPSTFAHYIERQLLVPYRKKITLRGIVVANGEEYQTEVEFYARQKKFVTDELRFSSYLKVQAIVNRSVLGNGEISAIDAKTLYHEGVEILSRDPYFFVRRKTSFTNFLTAIRSLLTKLKKISLRPQR